MARRPRSFHTGRKGALVLVLILLHAIPVYAGREVVLDPEEQFQFAEQYFRSGEYYRAIGEYERFIYFFPEASKVEVARYKIGLSYLSGERYEQAIQAFEALIEEYENTAYAFKAYIGVSRAHVLLGRYDAALTGLNNLITIAPDQEILDEAYYHQGWVYLEMGLWQRARKCFESISAEGREQYRVDKLAREIDGKTPLREKSPTVAGVLAIIPGAGHLYCNRKRDALISFLLNTAMIYAAYEAFDEDLDGLGVIISFFELGFYTGNIYSAVSSAHKYNRHERERFLDYLKEQTTIAVSLAEPNGRSLVLSCRISF
jgi:tetratricopeptide (TPR) repeat protein